MKLFRDEINGYIIMIVNIVVASPPGKPYCLLY